MSQRNPELQLVRLRSLRNRMIHEYVAEAGELLSALIAAHENIKVLVEALSNIRERLVAKFPELVEVGVI